MVDINDLCEYLMAKDGLIKQGLLPFSGRNKVLYLL